EFIFLESVSSAKSSPVKPDSEEPLGDADLGKLLETILEEAEEDEMYASELKTTLLRLRPDFNEKAFGCASFGKLLARIEQQYHTIHVTNDNYNMLVSLKREENEAKCPISKENFVDIFRTQLARFKEDGFNRINPSILKAAIQNDYPTFNERALGYKRFSDLMRRLEKEGLVKVEL
ncbi:MAG: OST-HTH/LOTUS domain-containing protein, partial [Clostridia bacterium]